VPQILPTLRLAARIFLVGWLLRVGREVPVVAAENINISDYHLRIWQVEDGLPQDKVSALAQTQDGYLWVATYGGLARFDGVQFTIFDEKNTPELRDSRLTSLFEGGDGTLWIGHESGLVTTYKSGKFHTLEVCNREKVYGLTADAAGDVWILNDAGLLIRVRDGLSLIPTPGTAEKILNLARTTNGTIWVAHDGGISRLEQGSSFQLLAGETNTFVQGICPSQDGGLWVNSDGRLRKWKDGEWNANLAAPWGAVLPLTHLMETSEGLLLATTFRDGFFLMFPGTNKPPIHFDLAGGFPSDGIVSVLEDREGNFWIGTGDSGLVELHQNNIQQLSPPDHWHGRAVLSVCAGQVDDELWVGTEGSGLYHYLNGRWRNFGYTNGLGNSYIWSIAEDTVNNLFVGTWGAGLFLQEGDHFKFAPGMENLKLPVPALLPARNGGLWVGTSLGLLRYQAGQTNWFTEAGGKSLRDVRAIAEATNGIVWFGLAGNGLARLENNRIQTFGRADGLPSDRIECLHLDAADTLWIGTFGGGLCRYHQGKFSVIDAGRGLPSNVISDIEDDGRGFFWMSSRGGIIRASKDELKDCADGKINEVHCLTYGIDDGMPTIECSSGLQPAGCRTSDGRIWFPTTKGLVFLNPQAVRINHLPPPMVLENLLVDGRRMTNLTAPLRIPPGRNRFEFSYTALSLTAPEKVRFKYRIAGLEKDWVDAGSKRVANYSFLPPGEYKFEAIACNNNGVWNETGVSLPFVLLPHFWQIWWFRVLGGVMTVTAAGGIAWFAARRRMHRKLELMARQHELEYERSRIARDIHDDLGSQLTSITMLSDSARSQLDDPQQTSTDLHQIYDTAREATRSMDEIVWAVNPNHDSLESLANYLEKYALDFFRAAGVKCRLNMPLQFPAWRLTSELRHNLFLAYKEALNNVAKHAAASEVLISLKVEATAFAISIEDNGRGFDPKAFTGGSNHDPDRLVGGNGVGNMSQRLLKIGGQCDFVSVPAKGTTVKFLVILKSR
jgi:signal transduction histidine kinase/ligand-binding sensor domain-containing protein